MKRPYNEGLPRKSRDHSNQAAPGQGQVDVEQVLRVASMLYEAGEPFTRERIARELGNIPPGRVQVHREALNALIRSWIDALLDRPVEDNDARRTWIAQAMRLRDYWFERRAGVATAGQSRGLATRYIQLGCDILLSEGLTGYDMPTKVDYEREFGYWPRVRMEAEAYRARLHAYLRQLDLDHYAKVRNGTPDYNEFSVETVLARVDPVLKFIPLTYLDDPKKYALPPRRILLRICNMPCRSVRQWAFLHAMIRPDAMSPQYTTALAKIASMAALLGYHRDADLQDFDAERHLSNYLKGKFKGSDGDEAVTRYSNVANYFGMLGAQEEWERRLTQAQRTAMRPFMLPRPKDDYFFRNSPLRMSVQEDRERVRKDRVAPVADRFYQLRFIVDIRFNELRRLRQGVHDAIAKVQSGQGEVPYPYSYEEETYDASGRKTKAVRHFILWSRRAIYEERMRRADDPKEKLRAWKARGDGNPLESDYGDLAKYFVQYVRTEDSQGEVVDDYWFMDLVRLGILGSKPRASALAWMDEQGYGTNAFHGAAGALSFRSGETSFVRHAQEDLSILLIPYEELYTGALFGRAIMRLGTTTGARIGEIGQISPGKKCLVSVEMPSGKRATAFMAVPKGMKNARAFYMDEAALGCVLDIVRRHKELEEGGFGGLEVVQPPPHLEQKCGPQKYIFQLAGKAFENTDMNSCLRFVLHGLEFRDSDGKTYAVTSHFLRHAFATEMRKQGVEVDILAELLNQKWVEVTRYYSRPTPAQVRRAAERSFITHLAFKTKCGVRKADEIRQMVEDAEGKVGALTNVLGGTCTEAGMCPAKFQCIGCAANAPDPAQREEVEMKRRYAMEWLKTARERNMTGEVKSSMAIITSCDDMLAEMDLLVAAETNSEQTVAISSGRRSGSNR